MSDKNKINIATLPEHVKTGSREVKKAYKEWLSLRDQLHNHPKRWYSIPDPDNLEESKIIDLIQAISNIRKWIKHVSNEEIEAIELIWKELHMIKMSIAKQKRIWDPKKYGIIGNLSGLDPYSADIIELFGQWKTNKEVKKIIYERWGYDVSSVKISNFKVVNQDKIDALRTEWEKSYDNFDVARKRGRIERLAYLAQTQMDKYKKNNEHSVVNSRELRAILEQIRVEVEGNKLAIDVNGKIDINSTLNMNLSIQRLTQKISINSFCVALVAAKRGIDPTKLMHKLTSSFYKQYNGFMQVSDNRGDIEYPSNLIQTYDWNEIDRMYQNGKIEDFEVQEAEVIEESNSTDSIKSKMMELLTNKHTELDRINKK